jgi:hypothetical protein
MSRDGDVALDGRAMRDLARARRARALAHASELQGWTKHTDYHWSRSHNGKRLDYWPSKNKFQHGGRIMVGSVDDFIAGKRGTWNAKP